MARRRLLKNPLLLVILVLLSLGGSSSLWLWRYKVHIDGFWKCSGNMRKLGIAFICYEADHGRFPDADRWVDQVCPYVKDWDAFRCPEDSSGQRSSYAMNKNLSRRPLKEIENTHSTVLLYETIRPGKNPAGTGKDILPQGRHSIKLWAKIRPHYFVFADGTWASDENPRRAPPRW